MATRQKVKMPNPGWLFFWIFSIVLFMFLSFHHGNYDVEDITPMRYQETQPSPAAIPPTGRITTEKAAEKSGAIIADMK